jgi:hypothetical protein
VVGREQHAEVDAENGLLHQHESDGRERGEDPEHAAEVDSRVRGEQGALDPRVGKPAPEQVLQRGAVHLDALEHEQHEEQNALVPHHEPRDALPARVLAHVEDDRAPADVRVELEVVGVAVVPVVVVDPPAVAHAVHQVRMDPAHQRGRRLAPEHGLVPGVVPDERALPAAHTHPRRDEQLPPRVADQKEGDQAGGDERGVEPKCQQVPADAELEQSRGLHLAGQFDEPLAGLDGVALVEVNRLGHGEPFLQN